MAMSKGNGTGGNVVDGVRIAVGEEVVVERATDPTRDTTWIATITRVTATQFAVGSDRRFLRTTLREVTAALSQRYRVRAVTDADRAEKRRTVLAATIARYAWDTVPLAVLASVEAELGLPPAGRQRVLTGDAELDRLRFRAAARLYAAGLTVDADDIAHDRERWRRDASDTIVSLVSCVGRATDTASPATMADCARSAEALAALIDLVNADLARKTAAATGTPS